MFQQKLNQHVSRTVDANVRLATRQSKKVRKMTANEVLPFYSPSDNVDFEFVMSKKRSQRPRRRKI